MCKMKPFHSNAENSANLSQHKPVKRSVYNLSMKDVLIFSGSKVDNITHGKAVKPGLQHLIYLYKIVVEISSKVCM